ncbi:hypothetical protein C9J12_29345 [Photobacterium frigidiphilum]|uniref:Uncharacterized protein n=1 Tax=Photobacterium frigidiphilum TaxID=264736 RepID=A0A2T3J5W4_9GAMM|nr:hypothetical protein [Photobacterium frigidiphilum]PSU41899.1 hypothetical protein C9J12_29345 [Photobacterium frigidiphilum]
MMNAITCKNPFYLRYIFKKSANGNNNIIFLGDPKDALKETSDFCTKHNIQLHIVDMKRPPLINKNQKTKILALTKKHERYAALLTDISKINNDSILHILNGVIKHSLYNPERNIIIVNNFHKNDRSNWEYEFLCSLTRLNRFCLGSVLFLDSSFD